MLLVYLIYYRRVRGGMFGWSVNGMSSDKIVALEAFEMFVVRAVPGLTGDDSSDTTNSVGTAGGSGHWSMPCPKPGTRNA